MSDLPEGWATANLGDVTIDIQGGGTPSKNIAENFTGNIPFMTVKDMKTYRPVETQDKITKTALQSCSSKLIPAGTPIVCTRMGLGKIVVADFATAINQDLKAVFLEKKLVDTQYFEYWYRSITKKINSMGTGTTVKGITLQMLLALQLPLPPTSEQNRIAGKLDELLAQVNTLKTRIDSIPARLNRFRQSVLAAAVSGRLTEEWRSQSATGSATNNQPIPHQSESSGHLPYGWVTKAASEICEFITKGTTPSKEKMTAGHGEVPYIKVYNLTFTGALNFSIDPTFVDNHTHTTDLKRSIVRPTDVLMNIVGPPLGKVSIVPASYPEWNINQAIARFTASDGVSPGYLALCLRSNSVLSYAISRAKATAGQFNLTLEICRELPIPLPPTLEQTEIVHRVEQLFAFAEQLEARVKAAQTRIDHLTQSILAKAFRGELVPQDPNDEPASVLLERIKSQRAAMPKAKRGRQTAKLG